MASSRQQPTDEERAARDVFARLAASTDEFEGYRHPHAERIAAVADALAKLFNFGRADRASLRIAALAHDLGEAAMRRDYIKRAGTLDAEERLDLARHPVIGEQEAARAGADRAAQLVVRWSHEWWNGCGYPDALRREQIPLAARLLRVADAYCSLTDERPFRSALTEEEARRHLAEWAGIEFDPRVVNSFLTLHGLPELRSHARRNTDAAQDDSRPIVSAANDPAATDEAAADPAAITNADPSAITNERVAGVEAAATSEASDGEAVTAGAPAAGGEAGTSGETGGLRYDDRSLGSRVPEAGVNPHAPTNDERSSDAASNVAGESRADGDLKRDDGASRDDG